MVHTFVSTSPNMKIFKAPGTYLDMKLARLFTSWQNIKSFYIHDKSQSEEVLWYLVTSSATVLAKTIDWGNFTFSDTLRIRHVLRTPNLTKLLLRHATISISQQKVLCKPLVELVKLKHFETDAPFTDSTLLPYWKGEKDPRPGLEWSDVYVQECSPAGSILKSFLNTRCHKYEFENSTLMMNSVFIRSIISSCQRSNNTMLFYDIYWRDYIYRRKNSAPEFLNNIMPQGIGYSEYPISTAL